KRFHKNNPRYFCRRNVQCRARIFRQNRCRNFKRRGCRLSPIGNCFGKNKKERGKFYTSSYKNQGYLGFIGRSKEKSILGWLCFGNAKRGGKRKIETQKKEFRFNCFKFASGRGRGF